jgi:hypothetical protein
MGEKGVSEVPEKDDLESVEEVCCCTPVSEEAEPSTSIDVMDLVKRISNAVSNFREISANSKEMDFKINRLSFAIDKIEEEYTLTFNSKIAIKPKEMP